MEAEDRRSESIAAGPADTSAGRGSTQGREPLGHEGEWEYRLRLVGRSLFSDLGTAFDDRNPAETKINELVEAGREFTPMALPFGDKMIGLVFRMRKNA